MPKITISKPKLQSVGWAPIELRHLSTARRIRVKSSDIKFIEEVESSLNYIWATTTGKSLLKNLFLGQHNVTINPDVGRGHEYFNCGAGASKAVVYSIRAQPFSELEKLFAQSGILIDEFAKDFAKIPEYTHYAPGVFNWPEYRNKWKSPSSTGLKKKQNLDKTGKNANDGITLCVQEYHPLQKNITHIWNSVIMALYETSDAGSGTGANIYFTPGKNDGPAKKKERPNAIALAHELIHACYSGLGLQPSGAGLSLDDLICIGIGPWKNKSGIFENNIRAEWNATVYALVPDEDIYNKILAYPRLSHMDIGTKPI